MILQRGKKKGGTTTAKQLNARKNRLGMNAENLRLDIYIFRVLRTVHSCTSISKMAMSIMNSFVRDMFEKLATEASQMLKRTKRSTLNHKDIMAATRLLLSGELSKHGISEGFKALRKFRE